MKKLLLAVAIIIPLSIQGQTWQRVLKAWVDDVYLAGAYAGGINYSRPFWVDIDADNDYDLFIGGEQGGMHFYRNDGTVSSASWTFIEEKFNNIDVGNRSSEAFIDIDDDGDYDLFIGEQWGEITFYRNEGTPSADSFVFVTDAYAGIDVGRYSAPIFCDIDNDGDYDLFIGEHAGNINYYRNDGTASSPSWTLVAESWFGIDVGTKNIPWFADIDADNDYDLFIGYSEGTTYYYRNDGTPSNPNMVYVTNNYIADVGNTNAPSFVDIDNDGDFDFFVGEYIGNINFYRNIGTFQIASWTFVRRHYLSIDMNSSSTPVLVDIDADGDNDLFSGEWVGFIDYYENSGTQTNHRWTIISENYNGIDVGDNSAPTFVDIDNDNDFDLFIGNLEGNIYYYRNDGSVNSPNFTYVTSIYNSIDVGDRGAPTFIDIDNDNDFDLFIGNLLGTIWYYRNDGNASNPNWTYVTNNYAGIDIGDQSIPTFADIDNDNDFDLFIGESFGTIFYYRNDGSPSSPSFTFVTDAFEDINVEENTAPCFIDINNDADLDLFIGERWGGLNHWEQIGADLIPPLAPYIYGEKSGSDAYYWWYPVTMDTAGNPENVNYYVIYRNTSPDFIPSPSDSIGIANSPETTFTDVGALNSGDSYYYLVKTIDVGFNKSTKSNMGYKFNKFFNENPGTTSDRNWTSPPWHSEYTNVSDLTNDLSPSGQGVTKITNLKDDQSYESWIYHFLFGWYGTDFAVTSGRSYEIIAARDTTLILVGSNYPDGLVTLNENPGTTSDRNWVSIPYNVAYSTVSGITTEFSPSGEGTVKITNLKDDQTFESWLYHFLFGWYGTDFAITPGRGYEFIAVTDTFWDPTEYSNRTTGAVITKKKKSNVKIHIGTSTKPDRTPSWILENGIYVPAGSDNIKKESRVAGISHTVQLLLGVKGIENITFTAYRPSCPNDVLTENTVGCGIVGKNIYNLVWFDVGNFMKPWQHNEEVILIIEVTIKGQNYFGVASFLLNKGIDIQCLDEIVLIPIPEPQIHDGKISWAEIDNENVIGYSVCENGRRLNNRIITDNEYLTSGEVAIKPVIRGGYETIKSSQGTPFTNSPLSYGFVIHPNPFVRQTCIDYAIPEKASVEIAIYDVSGRLVKSLVSAKLAPGYYKTNWHGDDDIERRVSAGVYFIRIDTKEFKSQRKIVFVR